MKIDGAILEISNNKLIIHLLNKKKHLLNKEKEI